MPLLENDKDLLAGFDPSTFIIPMPAQGSVWSQAPQVGKVAKELFVRGNYKSFVNVSQHALSQIGGAIGVPEWTAAGFETFFKLATKPVDASEIAKGVVSGTVQLVQGALSQAATAVPIVGLIVQLGLYLWEIIDQALKYTDAAERPPEQAIVYDLAGDLEAANQLKDLSGDKDWTTLFLPPAQEGWRVAGVEWTPGGGTEGYRVEIRPSLIEDIGLMPGIAERLGIYQFPSKDVGSTRPFNFYTGFNLSTTGVVLPSGRSFSALLWQTAMKPSVAMFQIDSHAMEDAWAAYFASLWAFSNTQWNYNAENSETVTWSIRRACTYCKIWPSSKGPTIMPPSAVEQGNPFKPETKIRSELAEFPISKLEDKLGSVTYRYIDIVRYVGKIHRARARAALRTLVCAYVPPNAPLLQSDPSLKAYHAEMRARLLTHPARYDVELDMIPDAAYRKAVDDSTILNPQLGGIGSTQITLGGPIDIDGDGADAPNPPGPQAPQGVSIAAPPSVIHPGFDIRHVAGIATTGLAASAAAYYFRDDLRRVVLGMQRIGRR